MMLLIFAIILAFIIFLLYRSDVRKKRNNLLRDAVQRRLSLRLKIIDEIREKTTEVSNEVKEEIVNCDLESLIDGLHSKKFTAIQVLRTYQEKAIQANEKTNCVTLFIKEAEEWAKALDLLGNEGKHKHLPLFGIPFSIKESICVGGYDQTLGFAQNLGRFVDEDGDIVKHIKFLGGVPFVLTNVPQSLLSYSCLNPIYGTTINAYKCDRTAGGSSGGEGSLIACGGSIIGIGGDVGGSLRFPAHFNGITSLKPSNLRFCRERSGTSVMGRSLVDASLGPMTRTVRDAVTFLKIFWSERWFFRGDPYLPAIYWDDHQYLNKQPLRIGYYYQDGWFEPTPALKRAVQETHSRLEKLGHVLVEFEPPDMADAFKLFLGAILVDDGKYILDKFDKDLYMKEFGEQIILLRIPPLLKRIFGKIVKPFWPRLSKVCEAFALNTSEMRQMFEDIAKYRHRFVREMKALRLDAIICPIQVVPAIEHFYPMKLISTVSYCGLFNLLDFPAGTVKVTEVSEIDELCLKDYPENDLWEKLVKKATKDSVGLPVGVQVASFPFHEETVLRLLAEIEKSVELEKIM